MKENDKKILELSALYEVARLASSSLDLDEALSSILHALSEQGGAFRLPPKRANRRLTPTASLWP